tara:strand:+ start:1470 stop:2693 length:1224 start_codon:yes stop_codon:yes gene_type:complete
MSKKSRWISKEEAIYVGVSEIASYTQGRGQARRSLSDKEWNDILAIRMKPNKREFVETQKKFGKDGEIVSTLEKLQSEPIEIPENFEIVKISTSKTTGQQWIQYKAKVEEVKDFDFESIISKYTDEVKSVKIEKVERVNESDFDSLTYTDLHIGMETNADNNSMYAVLWNRKEALKTADLLIRKTLENRRSNTLIVDELGDLLDGFNAQTTRGGHHLPQNMTNKEAFDCAIEFKMRLLNGLVPYYDEIVFNNICNDNHAGDFGYFVNKFFKDLSEQMYDNIKVVNHVKFINHYIVKDIAFVITHGKDDKALKFGFKPHLDTKSIEKIDQYCKHNKVYKNSDLVIFKKGDSHQCLFDMASSDDFYYYNYPASSPSSNWVQSNFKKGRRGFVLESFKGLENTIKPIFIK